MAVTEEQLKKVRDIYVGQQVLIYGGKQIRVGRVEPVNTPIPCFQFFSRGNDIGYVATLSQVKLIRAKGAAR